MTRSLAVEWAEYGIRSNAIAPGPFPTEGAWNALMPTPELEAEARARIPMKRFGEHEELMNLAAFLVSDGAPFINGECVTIDGGEWIASGGEFNGLTRMPRDGVKARAAGDAGEVGRSAKVRGDTMLRTPLDPLSVAAASATRPGDSNSLRLRDAPLPQ